jgi:hypothetical protein
MEDKKNPDEPYYSNVSSAINNSITCHLLLPHLRRFDNNFVDDCYKFSRLVLD